MIFMPNLTGEGTQSLAVLVAHWRGPTSPNEAGHR